METNKAAQLWYVNATSFVLFVILAFTGIINWLLPRGYETGSKFLISTRHFFRDIHEWTAVLFIFVMIIHLALHWPYVMNNLKKYGILK